MFRAVNVACGFIYHRVSILGEGRVTFYSCVGLRVSPNVFLRDGDLFSIFCGEGGDATFFFRYGGGLLFLLTPCRRFFGNILVRFPFARVVVGHLSPHVFVFRGLGRVSKPRWLRYLDYVAVYGLLGVFRTLGLSMSDRGG